MSLKDRGMSFVYAFRGLADMVRTQPNARFHAVATVGVIAAGFHFHLSNKEWRWIVAAIAAVWTAEAFNTAIENLVDLASPGRHPLAGKAKDAAAGAVLAAAIGAAVIGLTIFVPHFPGNFLTP